MPPTPLSGGIPNLSGSLNWWQSILLAATSALLGIISVVMAQRGAGEGGMKPQVLFRYVPHFLLLFGILADAFTYQGVYWTSTIVGLGGYFASGLLDTILQGLASMIAYGFRRGAGAPAGSGMMSSVPPGTAIAQDGTYDGCTFQGGSTETVAVPPTLTASSSVMWYFIIDSVANHGFASAVGSIFAFMALYGAQVSSITKCMKDMGSGAMWGLIYGLIVAGVSYSIISNYGPDFLPSSVANAGGGTDSSGNKVGAPAPAPASTPGTGTKPATCPGGVCPT